MTLDLTAMPTADVLLLTTTGRVTRLPREVELWFVTSNSAVYLLADTGRQADWVRNFERDGHVMVRLAGGTFAATARVLDEHHDADAWQRAQSLSRSKYGWGAGLPVEVRFTMPPEDLTDGGVAGEAS